MLNTKKRGILASAGALVTAVALAFGGAAAANAAPATNAPERSGLVITKLEQPEATADAATGRPLETLPGETIEGVSFTAHRVPLDTTKGATSHEAQQEIAGISLAEAQQRVDAVQTWAPEQTRSGKTDGAGEIRWVGASATEGDLGAGLWLIRETATPAGVVAAGDFLVALPLTEPTKKETWLDTVYVYPKNHTISGTKTVANADKLVVGDTVTWTVSIKNPSPRDPATGKPVAVEMFQITDELAADYLALAKGLDSVTAQLTEPNTPSPKTVDLVAGDAGDYTTALAGNTVTVTFTATGLAKLAENAAFDATVKLETTVLKQGSIKNIAQFTTSASQPKKNTTEAEIKYGDYQLVKDTEGAPKGTDVSLAGAEFMVFADKATAEAALKGDSTARKAALKPETGGHTDGVWSTDETGKVLITGLRYSEHADGAPVAKQGYWLVETKALESHQLLTAPVEFFVNDTSGTQTAQVIVNQYDRGGFVLPLTGGTGTLMLTVAGIALLAIVLIVARRRRQAAE